MENMEILAKYFLYYIIRSAIWECPMRSFLYFILGLLAIWITAFFTAFALAFVSEMVHDHLVDVFVMAPVLVVGMSIMSREIYDVVLRLGRHAGSERSRKHH
jgi:uncharacterized protein YacL